MLLLTASRARIAKKYFACDLPPVFVLAALLAANSLLMTAHAATYYVAVNGNNSWDGTAPSFEGGTKGPWATLARADDRLAPGDTVYVRGGGYGGSANVFASRAHGTPAYPITVASYPGETAVISNNPIALVTFTVSHDYWIVDGLHFRFNGRHLHLNNAKHCIIRNCLFGENISGSFDWPSVRMWGTSQFNKIQNCTFRDWGTVTSSGNDVGTSLAIGHRTEDHPTYYNVIENCRFIHAGHDLLQLECGWNVIRSNYWDNGVWIKTNSTYSTIPGGGLNPYGGYGNRITKPGDFDGVQLDERTVFEDNILLNAGPPPDDRGAFGIEMGTRFGIYRRNVIAFSKGSGIYINTSGSVSQANSNAIYANTIVFNGLDAIEGRTQITSFGYGSGINQSNFEAGTRRVGNWILNNILWGNQPRDIAGLIYTYQNVGTNWLSSLPNPLFVNTNGYSRSSFRSDLLDFGLRSTSPCIDRGQFLTKVTSENGTGTTLTVENAYLFSDGNRIVQGDTIQLAGDTQRATIANIDLATHTLTLSSPLTWTRGQGVALAYNGDAPDMGAYEYGAASHGPPSELRIVGPAK